MAYASKEKQQEYHRKYARDNAERLAAYKRKRYLEKREEILAQGKEWRENNPDRVRARGLYCASKRRAKNKGIEHTLTRKWIEDKLRVGCAVTGIEFDLSPGVGPRSASLDKIDPEKGYTPDNCRVICWALNAAFGDWGMEEFERIWNERKPV